MIMQTSSPVWFCSALVVLCGFWFPVVPVFAQSAEPPDKWMTPPPEAAEENAPDTLADLPKTPGLPDPPAPEENNHGHVMFAPAPDPPWIYHPKIGGQATFFFSGHPTDLYSGIGFSGQLHLTRLLGVSLDLRFGGGSDRDDDFYIHTMGSIGTSVWFWFRSNDRESRLQPYVRFGIGRMKLWDEHFNDGTDDDDDDWDWDMDKKSSNFKKNGEPAPGYSSMYTEEALGVRFVLVPEAWPIDWSMAVEAELALVQDHHYSIGDSALKFTLGFSIYH